MKISIIGKSTVAQDLPHYQLIKSLAYKLVCNGHTIIHGGYAGGMMQAASDGAQVAIDEFQLNQSMNIGIPEERFDSDYERVAKATFCKPSKDIFDRLRDIVGSSDVVIVAPIGGDGTMLEVQVTIHENMLSSYNKRPPTKLIFLQTDYMGTTDWKSIISTQLELLENSVSDYAQIPWIYFVEGHDTELITKDVLRILES
jgi:predicted Rossmann-fold nucleotide-binding protein